jgi:hypothetical protein
MMAGFLHTFKRFLAGVGGTDQPASGPRFVNTETFEDDLPVDAPKSTSTMSAEELKLRRMQRIEQARVGRPFHERVILFFLRIWLLVGPVAFVALTAAEVAYILTHLVAPGDRNGQLIIWGGALFIELAMMFTTFGLGVKRHEVAEQKAVYGEAKPEDEQLVRLGTGMWVLFALINILGQSAFLFHVIGATQDPNMTLLYFFVASRVVGFILGDAGTAFFLGHVESNDVRLMARGEREKGQLYLELAEAENKRKYLEAEADTKIEMMQIEVQQKRADAQFLAQLKQQTFTRILEVSGAAPGAALPAPDDLPVQGEFRTLGASGELPGQAEQVRMRRVDR